MGQQFSGQQTKATGRRCRHCGKPIHRINKWYCTDQCQLAAARARGTRVPTYVMESADDPDVVPAYRCPGCRQRVTYRPCQVCRALRAASRNEKPLPDWADAKWDHHFGQGEG